jgi:type VI secretion system protein ImpL
MFADLLKQLLRSRLALIGTIVLVVGLLAASFVRLIPWWLFFAILVLSVLGTLAFVFLRQWWARRKDAALEQGLDAQSQRALGQARVRDRENVRALQTQWKGQVEALRRSRIGRQKRWLYFLPWYVIIGAPASGKSTAIQNSGLRFPMGQPKLSGTGGTKNCDWWFAEDAIILDTAGRYAFSDDNEPDREEWLEFLRLLHKIRPQAPLNGLIVTVSADELLGREADELADSARTLRHKLDQLVGELGIQFPVYLLITKCDLIDGFTEFFGRLPRRRLDEMLGWSNPSWEMADPRALVHQALGGLRERVTAMRPGFLWEEERPAAARAIYTFPEELRTFQDNLEEFSDVLFRETQYNESPFLRGIFLTSGLQKGTAVSAMLKRLGLRTQATELREEKRSFFLKDFFQTRLAADRNLVATSGRAHGKLQLVHNVGLTVVAALCTLVAVVAGGSYVANRTLLNRLEDEMRAAAGAQAQPPAETIASLGRYVDVVSELEDRDRRRPLSARWGLWTGQKAIVPARQLFLTRFEQDGYLPAVEPARTLVRNRDTEQGFSALEALVRNYALGKLLNGTSKEAPGPNDALTAFWARAKGVEPSEEVFASYDRAYDAYLRWRPADEARAEEESDLALLRAALPEMFTVDAVERWADHLYPPLRAQDLPGMPPGIANGAQVAGAFRPEAWDERIGPLVDAVQEIAPEIAPDVVPSFRAAFRGRYYQAWQQFLDQPRIDGDPSAPWSLLLGDQTPYFAIVEKSSGAMGFDAGTGERPLWAQSVARVGAARADYLAHLTAIAGAIKGGEANPPAALEDVKGIFQRPVPVIQEGGEPPADPFGKAQRYVATLVNPAGAFDADDRAVRERLQALLEAPIYAGFKAYLEIAGEEIDRRWSRDVATRPTATCDEVKRLLLPPDGAVPQFMSAVLAPFYEAGSSQQKIRYQGKLGRDVAWLPAAQDRVRRRCRPGGGGAGGAGGAGAGGGGKGGGTPGQGKLFFTTMPSRPGPGGLFATRTSLTVWCGDGEPWTIQHRQYPTSKQLSWSKDGCSRAEVDVWVGHGSDDERRLPPRGADDLCDLLKSARKA